MTPEELILYVGMKVHVIFKGEERGIYGTLGYVFEFSEKYDYRRPGYFYINNLSFKASSVKGVYKHHE